MKPFVYQFFLLTLIACAGASGVELEEFAEAKQRFAELANPTETDRQNYLTRLAKLRDSLARNEIHGDCFVVDAEIRMHPAPPDTDGYTRLMVGEWGSPRHAYIYRADGTWAMLPEEEGTTRGRWRIEGNQYIDTTSPEPKAWYKYTILLLTNDDFIFTNGETVFYEERISE